MAKSVSLETWQLEHAQLGLQCSPKGKGHAGKHKFDGSFQDHSERVNLKSHLRFGTEQRKSQAKKKGQPTVFQYLKNQGYGVTYITMRTPTRVVNGHRVDTMVIVVQNFLFDNQIKRMGENVLTWYYENIKTDEMTNFFRP